MIALVEMANAHVFLAKVLGTGFGFLCNFAGRQFWVFDPAPRWRAK
jgi:putative flippase GtrA